MRISLDILILREGVIFGLCQNDKKYHFLLPYENVTSYCANAITKVIRYNVSTLSKLGAFVTPRLGLGLLFSLFYVDSLTSNLETIAYYREPVRRTPTVWVKPFGKEKIDKFLRSIAHIESNNGRNINHAVMQTGQHKGTAAFGKWGLMPLTIYGLVYQHPEEKRFKWLKGYGVHEITKHVTPELELLLARRLARNLLYLSNGNETLAAYRWYNGGYAFPSEEELHASDYVQKFKNHHYY